MAVRKMLAEMPPSFAQPIGSHEDLSGSQRAENAVMAHCGQPHRRDTAAPCAVGIAPELAGSNFRSKIR